MLSINGLRSVIETHDGGEGLDAKTLIDLTITIYDVRRTRCYDWER